MHIDLTPPGPVTCSNCGSVNAVIPVNDPVVAIRCEDCGHHAVRPEAMKRNSYKWVDGTSSTAAGTPDTGKTF